MNAEVRDQIQQCSVCNEFQVKNLQENTSSVVIEFLKEQFSRYGIPDTLITDNGPQFTSDEFRHFSRDSVGVSIRVIVPTAAQIQWKS